MSQQLTCNKFDISTTIKVQWIHTESKITALLNPEQEKEENGQRNRDLNVPEMKWPNQMNQLRKQ